MVIYGIPNCDSVKKAVTFFKEHKFTFTFHNFKETGISQKKLLSWMKVVGYDKLMNRKSTTWKNLTDKEKTAVRDNFSAAALMEEYPTVIKRPVVEFNSKIVVGFDEQTYLDLFQRGGLASPKKRS